MPPRKPPRKAKREPAAVEEAGAAVQAAPSGDTLRKTRAPPQEGTEHDAVEVPGGALEQTRVPAPPSMMESAHEREHEERGKTSGESVPDCHRKEPAVQHGLLPRDFQSQFPPAECSHAKETLRTRDGTQQWELRNNTFRHGEGSYGYGGAQIQRMGDPPCESPTWNGSIAKEERAHPRSVVAGESHGGLQTELRNNCFHHGSDRLNATGVKITSRDKRPEHSKPAWSRAQPAQPRFIPAKTTRTRRGEKSLKEQINAVAPDRTTQRYDRRKEVARQKRRY